MLDEKQIEGYFEAIANWKPEYVQDSIFWAFSLAIRQGQAQHWPLDMIEFVALHYAPKHGLRVPDVVLTFLALEGRL
jgi:hypothetical protein